jgi:hypothetical protein
MVGRFWMPYIGQAVGGQLELVLIGGAEERVLYTEDCPPNKGFLRFIAPTYL